MIRLAPGDPSAVMLGSDAAPKAVAEFRSAYGLDRPIPVQYLAWLGHVVRGDLGMSIYLGRPVTTAILEWPAGGALMLGWTGPAYQSPRHHREVAARLRGDSE